VLQRVDVVGRSFRRQRHILHVEQDRKPQMVLTRSTEDTEPDIVETVQQSGK
jgi:hypothetical protein